jgi:hypothetical protein
MFPFQLPKCNSRLPPPSSFSFAPFSSLLFLLLSLFLLFPLAAAACTCFVISARLLRLPYSLPSYSPFTAQQLPFASYEEALRRKGRKGATFARTTIPGPSVFGRRNLSPFTKDFRSGGRLWVYPNFWKRFFGSAKMDRKKKINLLVQ